MSAPRPPAPGRTPAGGSRPPEPPASRSRTTRREALGGLFGRLLGVGGLSRLGGLAGSLGTAALPVACADDAAPSSAVRLPLASLPEGSRLRVLLRGDPIEVRRTADGVAARSLLCTHQGCEVRWVPALSRYRCPCHEGMYNAEGVPIAGAPNRPLAAVPVRVVGDEVVVGEEAGG